MARKKSVEFDEACERALQYCSQSMQPEVEPTGSVKEALSEQAVEQIINNVPSLVRRGYEIVLEEQKRAPYDDQWQPRVKALQEFFRSMKRGVVPPQSQRTPAEAQALLNGMDMALRGQPLPDTLIKRESGDVVSARANGTWEDLCQKALNRYRDRVSYPRYQLAVRSLKQITVVSTATADVEDALRAWAKCRLECVSPRTVKNQLTSVTSALREVIPSLKAPVLKPLQGVLQPKTSDRQSMPLVSIRNALKALKSRPKAKKTRLGYDGGASQFDAFVIEVLAVLGLRPRELLAARTADLCAKNRTFEEQGLYLRITDAKNKSSERDIPLSDGKREVVDLLKLRELLEWQARNPRALHGAVTSLGTRFKKASDGYTLYQMRHTWKDIAMKREVDFEVRERLLGHRVRGMATVYGDGIPLEQGLNALMAIRSELRLNTVESD